MTNKAYKSGDSQKNLIPIEVWLLDHNLSIPCCIICDQRLTTKSKAAQKRAHFAHKPGSSCPSINKNNIPFSNLINIPKDPSLRVAAKNWTKENLWNIYFKIRKEFPQLNFNWYDMQNCLKNANQLDIWSYKGMQFDYISYVLLACCSLFQSYKTTKNGPSRKSDMFFVLEPIPSLNNSPNAPWNSFGLQKRYIYVVDITLQQVDKIEMVLSTPEPVQYALAKKLL